MLNDTLIVAEERSGWRDEFISKWHRTLGWNAPACDIDCLLTGDGEITENFVMIEFDNKKPRALIEYKNCNADIDWKSASIKATRALADMAAIPFFVCVYKKLENDPPVFWVHPQNSFAFNWLSHPARLSEREYVRFNYLLRGRSAPASMLEKFSNIK